MISLFIPFGLIYLPFSSLNAETKALTRLLARTAQARKSSGEIEKWTDKQGRTIEAKFLKLDGDKLVQLVPWLGVLVANAGFWILAGARWANVNARRRP